MKYKQCKPIEKYTKTLVSIKNIKLCGWFPGKPQNFATIITV